MSDMQKKILGALKTKAEAHGFQFVQNGSWANTGNVYIQQTDGFENVLTFTYDFQTGYCTLQFYPGDKKPVATCGFTHEDCIKHYHFDYSNTDRINEMLGFVETHLKESSCSQSGKKSSALPAESPKASGAP